MYDQGKLVGGWEFTDDAIREKRNKYINTLLMVPRTTEESLRIRDLLLMYNLDAL